MKNLKIYLTSICLVLTISLLAQVKIGNNPTTINAGSVLEIESTNKGFLFPRVSLAATTAWGLSGTAAAGMSVYNTNAAITGTLAYPTTGAGLYYFDGTGWVSKNAKAVATATEPWYNVATGTGATANTQNIYQMGNVGININNPGYLLDVNGTDASASVRVRGQLSVETNSANLAQIKLVNTAASGRTWYLGNVWGAADFGLRDFTANAYRFLIDGNGNVGIGTTAPASKLDVLSGGVTGLTISAPTATVNSTNIYSAANSYGLNVIGSGTTGQSYGGLISAGTNSNDLSFGVRNYLGSTYYMYVRGDGNVGIGTAQTTFKLNVLGNAQFGQTLAGAGMRVQTLGSYANIAGINHDNNTFNGLSFTTGASPSMYITTGGDVGINTASPGAKLEVNATATGVNTVIFRSSGANSNGIYAEATGGGGSAAYFNGTGTSNGLAAYALTGLGVYGQASSSYGIYGKTVSASYGGVIGFSGNNAVYGSLGHANQYSLLGNGDIFIAGNLAKASGTFKIDHPQDPANKYLIHSFVESPDMMNVYNGNIVTDADGNATVKLPDYFLALNKEFRYQLTAMGTFAEAIIAEEVNAMNEFKIKTDKPNVKISWQVTGIRQDAYANAHRIKDVVEKTGDEKGKYIHPELYNKPANKGIFYKEPTASIEVKKGN